MRLEKARRALCDKAREYNGHRRYQHHRQRDGGAERRHHAQRAKDRDNARQKLRQALQKPFGHLLGVVHHAADEIAVRMAVDELERRAVQHAKRLATHIVGRAAGERARADIHQPLAGCRQQRRDGNEAKITRSARKIDRARPDDAVDGAAGEYRPQQREQHACKRARTGRRQRCAVWPQIAEDAAQCFAVHAFSPSFAMPCERQISR